jgi:hypothetical protein
LLTSSIFFVRAALLGAAEVGFKHCQGLIERRQLPDSLSERVLALSRRGRGSSHELSKRWAASRLTRVSPGGPGADHEADSCRADHTKQS